MVTPAGYAHMTHMLMSLANGKIVVCLEVRISLLCKIFILDIVDLEPLPGWI